MERAEALARLQRSTRFQFVGERLVVRQVALLRSIAAAERVEEENGVAARRADVNATAPLGLAAA